LRDASLPLAAVIAMLLCLVPLWPARAQTTVVSLTASLGADPRPITSGLVWRIFNTSGGTEPSLVREMNDAFITLPLPPGEYLAHVAYGLASASKRILVGTTPVAERVPIAAGGLVIKGSIADQPIALTRLSVSIFIPAPGNSENKLIAENVKGGEILRLPEGTYHVVSSYGDSNSIVRADLRVQTGKLTQATMHHRAATITLKLVTNPGAEALANTAWSVLTPGGDIIREAIGAFPSLTLAEGDYIAIARNGGKAFQGEFRICAGRDRDVEILAREQQARRNDEACRPGSR
jgi:hypothetical protein